MKISYGWVIVAVGALMTCVGMGSMFSLAVFLQPISADTGWSRTGVSTAMTIDFLAMGAAAFAWGSLSDRYGTRVVVLAGAVLLGLGLIAASQATSLIAFQLLFGIAVGVAVGAFYAPMMAAASGWIENNRSLAVALVSAGMGVAPLTVAPFARWLITAYDWRTAMLIIGVSALVLLVPASFLVRQPPAAPAPAPGIGVAPVAMPDAHRLTAGQAMATTAFIAIALTHFACCAAHSGPIFHMVAYAVGCGLPAMTAVTVYSVAGFSGLIGRLALGMTADRIGAKPTLVAGLLVQALGAGAYTLVGGLGEFYSLSVIFGIAYGGVMPLYAILIRDYFGQRLMGTLFGAVSTVASLGMAAGPMVGGMIFDSFDSYRWLHLGSLAIGLGAVAIALTVRPVRQARLAMA